MNGELPFKIEPLK